VDCTAGPRLISNKNHSGSDYTPFPHSDWMGPAELLGPVVTEELSCSRREKVARVCPSRLIGCGAPP
jgi:hypothetical protein